MSYAEAASILVRPGVACCICGQEGESSDRQRVRHETAVSQALGNLKKEACEYETFRARRDRVMLRAATRREQEMVSPLLCFLPLCVCVLNVLPLLASTIRRA
jgi:hypothetical protein